MRTLTASNKIAFQMLVLVSIVLFAAPMEGFCEEETETISLDELRAPISPAFTLLGVSPTTVERPNTPRDLAIAILSAVERSEGDFPQDLAIEFAPYWMARKRELEWDENYSERQVGQRIWQTLSISLATTEIPSDDVDGTALGVGLRCLLIEGGKGSEIRDVEDELQKKIDSRSPDLLKPGSRTAELSEEQKEIQRKEVALEKLAVKIRDKNKQRVGWVVECATALTADFPEDDTGEREIRRVGAWLTPSYQFESGEKFLSVPQEITGDFNLLTVGRYIWDDTNDDSKSLFDIGGRVIWTSSNMPLSISAECVYRFVEGGNDTEQFSAVLEYKLNDDFSLVASYGKNFDNDFEGDDDLIAILGIKFGWGKGRNVKVTKQKQQKE